ncbi:sensor histidine kinase [Candidatus Protochlamydia sp. R18]|uniref:sensor histidine kinase n=1 Tax=Candidatus Protochlamydia sp. R18 TaxID=1353977 RepID=UPI0005AA02A4|nr:ATP-binding protein [Candidatus Protochlamydia sp. R18]
MFSFRQKIFISYVFVFCIFIIPLFPLVSHWVHRIIIKGMENRASEIIAHIQDAPNKETLIKRLKDQKSNIFFRMGIISEESKVLYDSHVKRILGPKFHQNYVLDHPEVREAFDCGLGFHEAYSKILQQKFTYFAKSFGYQNKTYVLRTAFPQQYVDEMTRDFEIGFLVFATAILLLFSVITWIAMNHLTKPIQKIIQSARSYQMGGQQSFSEIDTSNLNPKDDFTKLALTLNSLSAKIRNHIHILTQERDEKEAILESLVEGVIAVDRTMCIAYANHMAIKFIGLNQLDLIGQKFSSLNQEKYLTLLRQCQEEEKPLIDTLEINIEGKKLYLDIVAAPKRNNSGAILVLQDKTAHYKIFEMRRDFIANASHELKTPITIIRGFAEALYDNPGLPQDIQNEITTKIVRNCKRMTALIKDLLTLADIENIPSSRLSLCDLFDLTTRCQSMLHEIFPDAEVNIETSSDDIKLIVDEDLFELAIMNLIENAAKYSSRPAHIFVKLNDLSDHIVIEVADQGIGIPLADQEHIFDRFYTVDKAHSQKMGGSGLGLSIVKTIIEKHFGTITLKSELGKGSTFTITLPKSIRPEVEF